MIKNVRNILVSQGSHLVTALADMQEYKVQGFWLYKFWVPPNSKSETQLRAPGMQFAVKQSSPKGAFFICAINMLLILVAFNYQTEAFIGDRKKQGKPQSQKKEVGIRLLPEAAGFASNRGERAATRPQQEQWMELKTSSCLLNEANFLLRMRLRQGFGSWKKAFYWDNLIHMTRTNHV